MTYGIALFMRRRSRNKAQWLAQSRPNKPKENKKESRVSVRVPHFPAVGELRVVLGAAGGLSVALDAAGGVPVVLALVGGLGVVFGVLVSRTTWR